MNIKETIKQLIEDALDNCAQSGFLSEKQFPPFTIETPKMKDHGDYATNVAMLMAPLEKKSPRKIAPAIIEQIPQNDDIVEKLEVAGPGFINFFLSQSYWLKAFKDISLQGDTYGRSHVGQGEKINIEYVSANPTGPLHIGHGRGAAVGDALANILKAVGYDVSREYYINDAGNQMELLGKSVYARYLQLLGKDVAFPSDFYQGEYIKEIAQHILSQHGNQYEKTSESESLPFFTSFAVDSILRGIQKDLKDFGIHFDTWFSEKTLHKEKTVDRAIEELKRKDYTYQNEGHLWFKSTLFGDDKDRVVIRDNGVPTYFASDCAYHLNKLERGFKRVINIWGADHHGYIPRIKAVIEAFGKNRDVIEVLLVQFVNLLRDGTPVAMSTRSGTFVTLREVINEVGKDAVKYTFLTRRSDAHLDFDLEVAKKQSDENPVYYVQYAHARICNIIKFAEEQGIPLPQSDDVDLELLSLPEEMNLIKQLSSYPEMIESCALSLEPHRVTIYLNELVSNFHRYYHLGKLEGKHRVVNEDVELSKSRLWLSNTIRIVIKNALALLGVSAPEKM
ncbi:MAG: arginine--tRNA ligase [Deltaproteobacteria bacterium]|nr:arginine--tRNA ligase [Deltaproteobacteria bacterium]